MKIKLFKEYLEYNELDFSKFNIISDEYDYLFKEEWLLLNNKELDKIRNIVIIDFAWFKETDTYYYYKIKLKSINYFMTNIELVN